MQTLLSPLSFGTTLLIDSHPMTQKEVKALPLTAQDGLEEARKRLAENGRNDTLTLFYADDMVGQRADFEPNYLGFQLNQEYPPVTRPVGILHLLHQAEDAQDVVRIILDAYETLQTLVKYPKSIFFI